VKDWLRKIGYALAAIFLVAFVLAASEHVIVVGALSPWR